MSKENIIDVEKFLVKPEKRISLKDCDTGYNGEELDKKKGEALLQLGVEKLSEMQDKLYAHNEYSVLIVFQGMDAGGKDGAVKHIMTGLNPSGVKVNSFKTPSSTELDHDYFWRHYLALPSRGEIGIFNRSHYENVLITKVHPELILKENLPGIDSVKDIDQIFWDNRYKQIKRFEKNLSQNGTIILKFFLHLSKNEQKKRFLGRIDDPKKNWKYSAADVKERDCWKDYQIAYEEAINNTSTYYAPWFVIPADTKWFTRLAIAEILYRRFENLHLTYPTVSQEQKAALEQAKEYLLKEQ